MREVTMALPAAIGDFTDFSCSMHHMMRMGGGQVRPVFMHLPVGYHGRSSSLRPSGEPVVRPLGQFTGKDGQAAFGPEPQLDFEVEFGAYVGRGNDLGRTIPMTEAEERIFGYGLVNDWSARALQMFEMALGPWVVTRDALAPFRTPRFVRAESDPPTPAHLDGEADRREGGVDVELTAFLQTTAMRNQGLAPERIVRSNTRHLYWTMAQMLAHHASGGCNMQPGDLFASGTVSGPDDDAKACLMEANERGSRPIKLPTGEERLWLEDGDDLSIRGRAVREGFVPIGFGPCDGRVVAAAD
jgi:fumarylacetoacetase